MTLHYQFPHIHCLDDVLPAIEGRPEFLVTKEETGFTRVQYVMQVPGQTFDPIVGDDRNAAIRRECRGITFDSETGIVIARRLHKFFNVGEREDVSRVYFSKPHAVLEKLDGSMVTPIPVPGGGYRWATKGGISKVAMQAETFAAAHKEYAILAEWCHHRALTPIFEWCSNKARIVVDNPCDRLVLLHVRGLFDGRYLGRSEVQAIGVNFDIPVVHTLIDFREGNITTELFLTRVATMEGIEGFVLCFDDGHMVKCKTNWYVRLHRAKELLAREKDICHAIVTNGLDDLLPLLSPHDRERVNRYNLAVANDIAVFAKLVQRQLSWAAERDLTKFEFVQMTKAWRKALPSACLSLWDFRKDREKVLSEAVNWSLRFIQKYSLTNQSFNNMARNILQTAKWEEISE